MCEQAVSKPVWHTPLLCVQWKTPDDGQRNFAKHVEFYSKNKFEKLVHLVGFIINIYHDARPPEHQISVASRLSCQHAIDKKLNWIEWLLKNGSVNGIWFQKSWNLGAPSYCDCVSLLVEQPVLVSSIYIYIYIYICVCVCVCVCHTEETWISFYLILVTKRLPKQSRRTVGPRRKTRLRLIVLLADLHNHSKQAP